jgi:hypothetical protein
MSTTSNSGPEYPISLRPKTTTKVLIVPALAVIALCMFSIPTFAQGSLPLGSMATPQFLGPCSQANSWYYYTNNNTTYPMTCQTAVMTCPNTQQIGLTYGYLSPVGVLANFTQKQPNGVVVILNGGNGTLSDLGDFALAGNFFAAGYEVVEIAWGDDWEQTYDPFGSNTPAYGNIQNAACRPATFLNFVYNSIYLPITQGTGGNQTAGMCAHGDSAGSAAIAYSLAYYGAGNWLDYVQLASGPVLSDIEQGCQWNPTAAPVTICGQTNYRGGQYGCQLGGGSTWTLNPTYVAGSQGGVGGWTNDMSCANANNLNQMTTQASETRWLNQSIVDQSTGGTNQGAIPTFTYSSTAMSAWLCRSVANSNNYPCAANGNNNINSCPNNSSPQGQIFYANIGAGNPPPYYNVFAVDNCSTSEGTGDGNVPGFYPLDFGGTSSGGGTIKGTTSMTYDMVGYKQNGVTVIPAQCAHGLH